MSAALRRRNALCPLARPPQGWGTGCCGRCGLVRASVARPAHPAAGLRDPGARDGRGNGERLAFGVDHGNHDTGGVPRCSSTSVSMRSRRSCSSSRGTAVAATGDEKASTPVNRIVVTVRKPRRGVNVLMASYYRRPGPIIIGLGTSWISPWLSGGWCARSVPRRERLRPGRARSPMPGPCSPRFLLRAVARY